MLQQGTFVADIAYYYGEDSNVTALFQGNPPPIPASYNFDYVNSDVVKYQADLIPGRAAHDGHRDELPLSSCSIRTVSTCPSPCFASSATW